MILVLGGSGQVGKSLDKISSSKKKYFFLSKKKCNIEDKVQLKKIFYKYKPSYVVNLAAFTDVSSAEKKRKKAVNINCNSLNEIIKLSNIFNALLIHISTDYVFDGKTSGKYSELDKTNPLSVYGSSKKRGEDKIIKKSIKYIIIRTSGVFSHYQSNFFNNIIKLLSHKKSIEVVSDQFCFPTYSFDLAQIIEKIISSNHIKQNEVYNFTGHQIKTSWYSFAKKIRKFSKKNNSNYCKIIPIKLNDYKTNVKRPKNSCLDNRKIRKFIKLKSNFDLNIKKAVKLYYKNK